MIDHISLVVRDYETSKKFFVEALGPLGYSVLREFDTPDGKVAGLGADNKPDFWIAAGPIGRATHIAFAAKDRAAVAAFHSAAIKAGGRDNGAPGIRAQYHPNYYGAFVYDPDGNNIEAVSHRPE
jgi:catechol 2,3-dioxygenase-like lactoylglutathione lyase family enzyme